MTSFEPIYPDDSKLLGFLTFTILDFNPNLLM